MTFPVHPKYRGVSTRGGLQPQVNPIPTKGADYAPAHTLLLARPDLKI